MTDEPKTAPFVYDDTIYVADSNPVSDPIPLIDYWEFRHLGGSLSASGD